MEKGDKHSGKVWVVKLNVGKSWHITPQPSQDAGFWVSGMSSSNINITSGSQLLSDFSLRGFWPLNLCSTTSEQCALCTAANWRILVPREFSAISPSHPCWKAPAVHSALIIFYAVIITILYIGCFTRPPLLGCRSISCIYSCELVSRLVTGKSVGDTFKFSNSVALQLRKIAPTINWQVFCILNILWCILLLECAVMACNQPLS